jgi:hypothetical protein
MSMLDSFFDKTPEGQMARKLGVKKQEVQELFNEFDKDGSGNIDSAELQQFAASFGLIWDAGTVEDCLKEMDTDGNGTVDLKEFATWFCKMPESDQGDQLLKIKMQVKLMVRQVTKALKDMRTARPGKDCKNTVSFQIGEVDTETSSGQWKFEFSPSSSEKYAAFSPPEGAYVAAFASFYLTENHTDEDVEKIREGAKMAFEMFVEPMLGMIPPPPAIPGLKEAKGYHSYEIRKEDDQLKLIVFSDIDVAQVYRDTGLEVGDYVPHFHVGLNFGSPLSFLDPNGGCTLADLFAAKFEVCFQWNTRVLHAMKALASTKVVKGLLTMDGGGRKHRELEAGLGMASALFRGQNSSFDLAFNGFQEACEAGVIDVAMPMAEQQFEKKCRYSEEMAEACKGYYLMTPLPRAPSEEEISNIIKSIGAISGKTFDYVRKMGLGCGPLVPNPMYQGDWDMIQPCTPLYPAKAMIESIPMMMPFLEPFIDLIWVVLRTIKGYGGHGFTSEVAHAGIEIRGLNWAHLLPTQAEIEASEACEPMNKEEFMMNHVLDHLPPIARWFVKEVVLEAQAAGFPIPPLPPPIQDKLTGIAYTDEEIADIREGLSEVFDIVRAVLPLIKLIDENAPICQQVPLPVAQIKPFAIGRIEALIGC